MRRTWLGGPRSKRRPADRSGAAVRHLTRRTHKSRAVANMTDPDSRLLKTRSGYVQGYNAQAVATEDQFVVAAEATNQSHDAPSFAPMITATKRNLRRAGENRRVRRVVADAGYWSDDNVNLAGVESIIAPGKARKLNQIADADHERSAVLAGVEAGEIDKPTAAAQLGVTRTRVNQLLRRRRTGVAESLTTTMIATARHPARQAALQETGGDDRARLRPDQAQPPHPHPLPSRPRRRRQRVEADLRHTQPAQALP